MTPTGTGSSASGTPPHPEKSERNWKLSIDIAAVTTVLSTLLSGLALYASFRSLNVSNQSMVVGQRAYLSISDGKLEVSGDEKAIGRKPYSVSCKFLLQNLGNTPAAVSRPRLIMYAPKQWDSQAGSFRQGIGDESAETKLPLIVSPEAQLEEQVSDRSKSNTGKQPLLHTKFEGIIEVEEPAYQRQVGPKTSAPFQIAEKFTLKPEILHSKERLLLYEMSRQVNSRIIIVGVLLTKTSLTKLTISTGAGLDSFSPLILWHVLSQTN
jgi:hypothetical protein